MSGDHVLAANCNTGRRTSASAIAPNNCSMSERFLQCSCERAWAHVVPICERDAFEVTNTQTDNSEHAHEPTAGCVLLAVNSSGNRSCLQQGCHEVACCCQHHGQHCVRLVAAVLLNQLRRQRRQQCFWRRLAVGQRCDADEQRREAGVVQMLPRCRRLHTHPWPTAYHSSNKHEPGELCAVSWIEPSAEPAESIKQRMNTNQSNFWV